MIDGKKPWFPVNFPLSQAIDSRVGRSPFFGPFASAVTCGPWARGREADGRHPAGAAANGADPDAGSLAR